MTKRVAFTQAQVRRTIQAARREGLRVAGIKPDGTVVVYDGGENPLAQLDGLMGGSEDTGAVRWGDGDG
jgi:hypothetical protein